MQAFLTGMGGGEWTTVSDLSHDPHSKRAMKPDFLEISKCHNLFSDSWARQQTLSLPLQLHCLLDVRTICCIQHPTCPPFRMRSTAPQHASLGRYTLIYYWGPTQQQNCEEKLIFPACWSGDGEELSSTDRRVMWEGGQAEEAGASFRARQVDRSGLASICGPSPSLRHTRHWQLLWTSWSLTISFH